ncbi:hypothetical protein Hdeb2414_s0007g00247511 [Helianthus debilis subsp. tardiflorus]
MLCSLRSSGPFGKCETNLFLVKKAPSIAKVVEEVKALGFLWIRNRSQTSTMTWMTRERSIFVVLGYFGPGSMFCLIFGLWSGCFGDCKLASCYLHSWF